MTMNKNTISNTITEEGYALKLGDGYYCGNNVYGDFTENIGFTTRADCVEVHKHTSEPKQWIHPPTNGQMSEKDILSAKTVWVRKTVITIIEEI